jgi:hypothetical protein
LLLLKPNQKEIFNFFFSWIIPVDQPVANRLITSINRLINRLIWSRLMVDAAVDVLKVAINRLINRLIGVRLMVDAAVDRILSMYKTGQNYLDALVS